MKKTQLFGKLFLLLIVMISAQTKAQTFLNESFTGTAMPTGWTAGSTTTGDFTWTFYDAYDDMEVYERSGTAQNEHITTPSMNLSSANNVYVSFSLWLFGAKAFLHAKTSNCKIIVSRDNFASQTVIFDANSLNASEFYTSNLFFNKTISKSLTNLGFTGAGNSNVKIRFLFTSTGAGSNYGGQAYLMDLKVSTDCAATSIKNYSNTGITWYPIENFSGTYDIEYGPIDFVQGNGTLVTGLTGTSYSFPTPQCSYKAYIRANCGSTQSLWVESSIFKGNLFTNNVSNITTNSVTFNWTTDSPSVNIEYGPAGFAAGTGTQLTFLDGISHTITGLNPCTKYSYNIRTNCGGVLGNMIWGNFVTAPTLNSAISIPFTETFDNTLCALGYINVNGNSESGSIFANRMRMIGDNNYNGGSVYTTVVESRPFQLTQNTPVNVSFTYQGVLNGNNDYLIVYLKDEATGQLKNITSVLSTNNITVSNASGVAVPDVTGLHRLVFKSSYYNTKGYYVDNLSVGNCAIVLNRDYSYGWSDHILTTTNSALFNFYKNYDSAEIEYGPSGFTQGTGTMISNITADTYTVTGLSSCTRYDFYYREKCGTTYGSWKAGAFETKPTLSVTNVPYTENFTGSTLVCSSGWKRLKGQVLIFTGTDEISFTSNGGSSATPTMYAPNYYDTRFITKGINLIAGKTYKISYKYKGNPSTTTFVNNPTMKVTIGTTEDINSHTVIKDFGAAGIPSATTYTLVETTYNCTTSGTYYIGFDVPFVNTFGIYYFDDFSIVEQTSMSTTEISSENVKIYPNPTTGIVHIDMGSEEIENVNVFDQSGRLVFNKKMNNSKKASVDIGNLPSGIYIMEVKTKNSKQVTKVMKK